MKLEGAHELSLCIHIHQDYHTCRPDAVNCDPLEFERSSFHTWRKTTKASCSSPTDAVSVQKQFTTSKLLQASSPKLFFEGDESYEAKMLLVTVAQQP